MEVPALVVVADAASITNKDGSLNLEKANAVVKSGGLSVAMDAPDPDAPLWLRQRWDNPLGGGEGIMVRDGADTVAAPADPKWIGGSDAGPEPGAPDWHATETRPDHISTEEWQEIQISRKTAQDTAEKHKRSQEEWLNRGYQDRRKAFRGFKGSDKRVAMDRRGRGF